MSTLVVNRRRDENPLEPRTIPNNDFVIKEGNQLLAIINVLRRDPLTSAFSGDLVVDNGVPTPDETTFDFVGFTLTAQQETDALSVITAHRDKAAFTTIDQMNIDNQAVIDSAIEQVGDIFDEDNIDDLVLPDICTMRDALITEYNTIGWANLSVGEKRILVADWLIPTLAERIELFPGGAKRTSIYKLFSNRMANIKLLEFTNELINIADNFEGDEFTKLFKKATVSTKYKPEVFISRSNIASADANLVEVDIPVFSNVRTTSPLINVLSDTEAEFTREATVDIQFSCQVNANGSTNHQVRGVVNGTNNIDGQMRRDGRGRDTSSHSPIRVTFSQGDIITLKLNNQNAGAGAITAASGRSVIRIDEILEP